MCGLSLHGSSAALDEFVVVELHSVVCPMLDPIPECFETVALAKYPKVSVKLSASSGLSREPYPFRDVAVHIKRVFDACGPRRS